VFEHASGFKMNDTNFGNFFGRMYQPRYLSGMAAGAMTESGQLGYVAAFPIPEVIRGINAFTLGVRETNPSAEVHVIWTFTWFDPAVEGDSAKALLEAGADVIAMHQDSTAAGVAAQDAGARWVAYNSDMRDFAPDAFITAPVWNWGPRYAEIIEAVAAGTYSPGAYWGGMDDGIVDMAPLADDVPSDVASQISDVAEQIREGEWDVFTGEIRDQDGNVRVAAGETMDDGPMLGMDWFVEGVVGGLMDDVRFAAECEFASFGALRREQPEFLDGEVAFFHAPEEFGPDDPGGSDEGNGQFTSHDLAPCAAWWVLICVQSVRSPSRRSRPITR